MARAGRRLGIILTVLSSVVIAAIVAGLPFYVFPKIDNPDRVDAVLIIGPAGQSRRDMAIDLLLNEQLSANLVVSVPADGPRSAERWSVCNKETVAFTVYCYHSEPFTTLGEARGFADLAAAHGWDTVAVITSTPHITRARMLIERCYSGDVAMLADDSGMDLGDWIWQYVYQTMAFIKSSTVTTDCPVAAATALDATTPKQSSTQSEWVTSGG